MIDRSVIRARFRQWLLAMPNFSDYLDKDQHLALENRGFTPPNPPHLWLRENFNWGDEPLIATNLLELTAFVQYDVFGEIGKGVKEIEQLAKRIGDRFRPGQATIGLGNAAVQIEIIRSATEKGLESSVSQQVWYQLPVRISFRAYGSNN